MKITEVLRKVTKEMVVNELDVRAFRHATERFEKIPQTITLYSD